MTYMAPEQASGEAPVAASDWYSVGALLYEAIVGHPPFGGSAIDVLTLKYTVAPTAPSSCVLGVPDDLNALCIALLAPDPEGRARPRPRSCAGSAPRRATRPPRTRGQRRPRGDARSSAARPRLANCRTPSRRREKTAPSRCASAACPASASR